MFLTMFTSPFKRTVLPSEHGVSFDVTACPLANYCRDQGVAELTLHAACVMDHFMVREWGVTLERSGTIAGGQPRCDFRFQTGP